MLRPTRIAAALFGAAVLVFGSACTEQRSTAPDDVVVRGEVVSTTLVAQLSADELTGQLGAAHLGTEVRNGVDAYRVIYRTIDPAGEPTTASGLVALPRNDSRQLRMVSYAHGTIVRDSDAPSVSEPNRPDRIRTIMFAAAGYAAVAPDYLGLGEGPGLHPYAHTPSEASASIDLLRAARTVLAQQQREIDPNILVTGFSQGGAAATALGKALQAGEAPGFGLAALAPVSGPYDVRHVEAPGGLDGRVTAVNAVFYFAYWITSMDRIYDLYDSPAEAFQQPYADRVEQLFDGSRGEISVITALPATPLQLLTPEFVERTSNPTGAALKAMADSDATCDWSPRAQVRLYAATGDRSVLYANAERCLEEFRSDQVTLVNLGDVDHSGSARNAFPLILGWFQEIAPAT